jgi:hypothetical protein
MGAVIKAALTEWLSWPRPQQLAGRHDVLLRLLLDQQGFGHALDGDGETRRGLSRGGQSPSFRFREQPPM